jgi:biotin carboxylase
MLTILCIATYLKGETFLRECQRLGATVLLVTSDTLADAEWPRDAVREIHTIARGASDTDIRHVVSAIARRHRIDRLAALDDFDVETGAMLREFFQIPGFGRTVAARFRDKLRMRAEAKRLGLQVPPFTPVFNDHDLDEWVRQTPPPWVLKPRSSAAAIGIRKIDSRDELRSVLEAAGDDRPMFLLEQFVNGEVYHVDSIVRNGTVVFDVVSKYARPPLQIAQDGGVFVTRSLSSSSAESTGILQTNRRLLTGFDLRNGVSHSEYILAESGVTFLETSARVGGAYIVDVVEAATGVNLWREWAKLEIAGEERDYPTPVSRSDSAGIVLCLARQADPDLSSYTDPEIVMRIRRPHHAGLIVRSADSMRVEALLHSYAERFSRDFLAILPAPERPLA